MANIPLIMDKIRRTLASQENGYKNFVAKYMEAVVPDKQDLMTVACFNDPIDFNEIFNIIGSILKETIVSDPTGAGGHKCNVEAALAYTQALKEIMCEKMTEHEFVTLIRFFRGDPGKEHSARREMIRSLVFTQLTRGLWDDRERLREGLIHADPSGSGVISIERMRQLLKAHRLPIAVDLLDCMMQVLLKDENCNIHYEDLMSFLDFKTRPVVSLTEADYDKIVRHAPPLKDTECKLWSDKELEIQVGFVNWSAFLCQLNLEHLVKQQN